MPAPSFEESSFVYSAFGIMGERIGNSLDNNAVPGSSGGDIWLSKAKLPWGIQRIVNESEFDEELSRHGVKVIYPETMTITEQLKALEACRTLMGSVGSALHATAFARKSIRIRALAPPGGGIVENYSLMDAVKRHDALYFNLRNLHKIESKSDFSAEYRLKDPKRSAQVFLDAAL